jgi:hypothetical protein
LTYTADLATGIQNDSSTAIDNIVVTSVIFSSSFTSPIVNGLSDHDAQSHVINNSAAEGNCIPVKQRTRTVNDETIMQFQLPKSKT